MTIEEIYDAREHVREYLSCSVAFSLTSAGPAREVAAEQLRKSYEKMCNRLSAIPLIPLRVDTQEVGRQRNQLLEEAAEIANKEVNVSVQNTHKEDGEAHARREEEVRACRDLFEFLTVYADRANAWEVIPLLTDMVNKLKSSPLAIKSLNAYLLINKFIDKSVELNQVAISKAALKTSAEYQFLEAKEVDEFLHIALFTK